MARRAAASAASCAANGVDLREPLNPTWPLEAQAITAPEGSVMDTIVLLNVDLMCAWPWATFFFSLRRTLDLAALWRVLGGIAFLCLRSSVRWPARVRLRQGCPCPDQSDYFLPAFFLPATVLRGPLRVRALVCVRCPRTGRPRRCRMPW